ncbi:hypothetical protein Y032_0002g1146 [Ancylostoma ceylanicum]|uniref:Uncharacterized protein n=1 Tax=Ancylostoma ceylanicum TaxID=53326 RepID=A0A016VZ57_9BILA|nr:hypothetical protein Y032_0002g1146 [Ancylostoma ceylanicum]
MVILIQCCSFAAISLDLCLSVSASSPSLHYFARLVPSQSAAYGSEVCLGPVSQFTFGQVELGNFYPSSLKNFQLRRTSRMTVISCETPYVIDIRLPPTTNFKEMDELIDSWCKKAGPGVTYKFLVKTEIPVMTPTTSDDPFWAAFEKSLQDENCDFEKEIFTGATDSRFVREVSANLGLFCSMRFHRPSSDRCRSALHRMLSSS